MANVKVRFADNSDDRRITNVQLLSTASVKREPRSRPTKNNVANLAPLRFRRYFNNNDAPVCLRSHLEGQCECHRPFQL